MISKLLSLSPDEKLLFKSNPTSGIARLFTQPNIPPWPTRSESEYWQGFLDVFDSPSDVFSIFSLGDINKTLAKHPENIESLVLFLFQSLEQLARHDDHFCLTPNPNQQLQGGRGDGNLKAAFNGLTGWIPNLSSSSSNPIQSEKAKENISNQKNKRALNSIRLLTRLIPVILEAQDSQSEPNQNPNRTVSAASANRSLENRLFWSRRSRDRKHPTPSAEIGKDKTGEKNDKSQGANGMEQPEDQFVIQDEDDEEDSAANSPSETLKDPLGANAKPSSSSQAVAEPEGDSQDQDEAPLPTTLAEDLLSLTVDLLFYSGFTIPWTSEHIELLNSPSSSNNTNPSKVNPLIWHTGIGSTTPLPTTSSQSKTFTENRIEVLRLLLTLLSKSMYVEPHLQSSLEKQNLNLRFLVCDLDRDRVLKVLCSLLNLVGNSALGGNGERTGKEGEDGWFNLPNPNLVGMGMGIGNMNPNVNKDANTHSDLITLSLQILNILLYFDPLPLPQADPRDSNASQPLQVLQPAPSFSRSNSNQSQTSTSSQQPMNLFRYYLSKLHLQKDFSFLFDSLISILSSPFNSSTISTLLTSFPAISSSQNPSNPHLPNSPEALLLLWKLITCNKKFRSFVVQSKERSQTVLGQLLNYGLYSKDSIQLSGLTRLCVFILQDLSSSKAFSENISLPNSLVETKKNIAVKHLRLVGADATNNGTASDLMIQVIYSLIATTKSSLISLYVPLILIISNTSSDFQKLSIKSSNRLLSLFKSFSHPNFLLSEEINPRILFYLLESFNNIIRFHPKENLNFIYAVLKNKDGFSKLEHFSLRAGLGEIRRLRGFKNHSLVVSGRDRDRDRNQSLNSNGNGNGNGNEATGTSTSTSTSLSAEDEKAVLARKDQEEMERIEKENQSKVQDQHDVKKESNENDPLSNNDTSSPSAKEPVSRENEQQELSERIKGKMRKISITGLSRDEMNQMPSPPTTRSNSGASNLQDALIQDLNEDELYEAARTVGRNGFVASEQWVNAWQKELPLSTIQTLLKSLVQKVEDFSTSDSVANKVNADERVLVFLRDVDWDETLRGDVSRDSKPQTRNFIHNQQSKVWILSYLWGLIYLTNLHPLGIFSDTNARLFLLKSAAENHGGAAGSRLAGQVVGQIWEGLGGLINLSGGGAHRRNSTATGGRSNSASSPVLNPQRAS